MELKDYQASALDDFTRWLDVLNDAQIQVDSAIVALTNEPGLMSASLMLFAITPKPPGSSCRPTAAFPPPPANTFHALTMPAVQFRISVSKFPQAGARPCWPPPPSSD